MKEAVTVVFVAAGAALCGYVGYQLGKRKGIPVIGSASTSLLTTGEEVATKALAGDVVDALLVA